MVQLLTITWYIIKFVFQLLMTVVGIILIPLFLFCTTEFECEHESSRPNHRFKNKWFDAIFGNKEDGIDGDKPYKAKYENIRKKYGIK